VDRQALIFVVLVVWW